MANGHFDELVDSVAAESCILTWVYARKNKKATWTAYYPNETDAKAKMILKIDEAANFPELEYQEFDGIVPLNSIIIDHTLLTVPSKLLKLHETIEAKEGFHWLTTWNAARARFYEQENIKNKNEKSFSAYLTMVSRGQGETEEAQTLRKDLEKIFSLDDSRFNSADLEIQKHALLRQIKGN